ncbi:MAG: penicillin acylase family protein, partial [Pseudomonadota bacterium]
MNRLLRWLLRGVLATAVLGVLALAVVWVLIAGSLPEYEGQVITDVRAPVEIVRDANALPHIRAETARDVWFALGLVHAQDRLWQMEVARRSAQGRLSELLGARTVSLDRLVRTLDLYGYATRAVAHQSAAAQEALTAYAAGVNAWIRHVDAEALGRGAPEFYFYGQGLAPWRPADSLAILKMMALRLTNAASLEVRRAQFQLALPAARVADILPEYPSPAVLSVPRYGALFPGAHFGDATAPPSDPLTQALG